MAASPPRRPLNLAGLAVLGSEMTGGPLVGLFLDFVFHTMPWLTLVCSVLGIGLALYHLYRLQAAGRS